jgi:SpoVK/Ycf46/Vps4 family AAA+-type ATPase
MDRFMARIGPQAQSKHIGEAEGSLYVEPVVGFKSDARFMARIGPQAQSKHIGEAEGSLDV